MIFNLKGKTAIVTGAGSGIGRAVARLFAQQGAHVFLFDISEAAARAVQQELQAFGVEAHSLACDVSERAAVENAFAQLDSNGRRLDILVNNAGISHVGNALTTDEQAFDRVYRVNVKGVFLCAQAALRRLQPHGGVILNLASIASFIGLEERFAYSMSKGAVLSMTRSIAADFMTSNIRCNCICPARVHTPFVDEMLKKNYPGEEQLVFERLSRAQPMGRMGTPEEVAALALYLCSDEAAFVTGQAFPIDGGVLGAPSLAPKVRSNT